MWWPHAIPGWRVRLVVYGLAATVSASRVMARQHFPSDVVVGSTLGYLIGGYVVHKRGEPSKSFTFSMVDTAERAGHAVVLQLQPLARAAFIPAAERPSAARVRSMSVANSALRRRMPSTTGAGALARKDSFASWRSLFSFSFSQLRQVFAEALALGLGVDGLLVDDGDIEGGGGAVGEAFRTAWDHFERSHAREALDSGEVLLEDGGVARTQQDGDGFAFRHAGILACGAHGDDEGLQLRHLAFGSLIDFLLRRDRIGHQRDGACRGMAVVKGVPDLFSDEGHERREHA